ncbi:YbbR-like domain-containing protein [Microscilla marina]|nr:hypothetical protein [Microscilla marina]
MFRSMVNKLVQAFLLFRDSNAKVIVVCLFLSTMLWFTLELNKEQSIEVSYPVSFEYNDSLFIPTTPLPKHIRIMIKGTGWQVLSKYFGLSGKSVVYDINGMLQSYVDGSIHKKTYILPALPQSQAKIRKSLETVELLGVLSDTLSFTFDRRAKRTLPLSIYHEKALAEDFQIDGKVTIEPQFVVFEGPEKMVKNLADPFMLELPEKNIKTAYDNEVTISLPANQQKLIVQDKKTAKIQFDVAKFMSKTFRVPVMAKGFPSSTQFTLSNRAVQLKFHFKASDLGQIRLKEFKVYADFSELNPADSTIKLKLIKPAVVTDYQMVPNKIKLRNVEKKDS